MALAARTPADQSSGKSHKRRVSKLEAPSEAGDEKKFRGGNAKEGKAGGAGLSGSKKCSHCKRPGHTDDKCWVKHPELKPIRNHKQSKELELCPIVPTPDPMPTTSLTPARAMRTALRAPILGRNTWYIDSGASDWMCKDHFLFKDYIRFIDPMQILMGDDSHIYAYGKGTVVIKTEYCSMRVKSVLFAPKLGVNLLSVRRITEREDTEVIFRKRTCTLKLDDETIAEAVLDPDVGLFELQMDETTGTVRAATAVGENPQTTKSMEEMPSIVIPAMAENTVLLWHSRLGHLNEHDVK